MHLGNLWVVSARSLDRRQACQGIQFVGFVETLGDVRQGIQLAAEQDHRTLRPILVHLVEHRSCSEVAGTKKWGSVADRVETVAAVVHRESPFEWDTETRAGPTGTWCRLNRVSE